MATDRKWLIKNRKADPIELSRQLGVSAHLAQMLICRSICDARQAAEFLNPRVDGLHDAHLLKDVGKAVELVRKAAANDEKVLVIGDYDVDGVMGALILSAVLSKTVKDVSHYIPSRIGDGYGVSEGIVESAAADGVGLIVTCDNGISAHGAVRLAKELGMDVIVTDHHEIPELDEAWQRGQYARNGHGSRDAGGSRDTSGGHSPHSPQDTSGGHSPHSPHSPQDTSGGHSPHSPQDTSGGRDARDAPADWLPPADAVINPKRRDCGYPFKHLCGAAVALKFAEALISGFGLRITQKEREELLCFAAIATVCDIVELQGENRALVHHGLKILNRGSAAGNVGLAELMGVCGLSGKKLTARSIGFVLGPCLNAAGRLDSAERAYGLFVEKDRMAARAIALSIHELNRQRQDMTAIAFERAVGIVGERKLAGDAIIALYVPQTHESVAGIVAGRLKDKYAKPALVFTDSQPGLLKGSGRSVEEYNMLRGVSAAKRFLAKYGGHALAVGITIEKRMLPHFRDELLNMCSLSEEQLAKKELIDMVLDVNDISMSLIEDIDRLEPFGKGNPEPTFAMRGIVLENARLVGSGKNVAKLKLLCGRKRCIGGVYFGDMDEFAAALDMAPDANGVFVGVGGSASGGSGMHAGDGNISAGAFGASGASGSSGAFGASGASGSSGSSGVIGASGAFGSGCCGGGGDGSSRATVDIVFRPEINEYNGTKRIQLVVRAIRLSKTETRTSRKLTDARGAARN
jgi:single-stranded-DNA-specific exonuclease